MSEFNLRKNPLKIVLVGPQKVGKTTIANSLSEFLFSGVGTDVFLDL